MQSKLKPKRLVTTVRKNRARDYEMVKKTLGEQLSKRGSKARVGARKGGGEGTSIVELDDAAFAEFEKCMTETKSLTPLMTRAVELHSALRRRTR